MTSNRRDAGRAQHEEARYRSSFIGDRHTEKEVFFLFDLVHKGKVLAFSKKLESFTNKHTQSASLPKILATLLEGGTVLLLSSVNGFVLPLYVVARMMNDNPDFAVLHILLMLAVEAETHSAHKVDFLNVIFKELPFVFSKCQKWGAALRTAPFMGLFGGSSAIKGVGQAVLTRHLPWYRSAFEDVWYSRLPIKPPDFACHLHVHWECLRVMTPPVRVRCSWQTLKNKKTRRG